MSTSSLVLPAAPATPRRRPPRALWAAGALGGFAQSLSGSAGALLAREISDSDGTAGLPQAAVVTGAALSALALSWIAGRAGRRLALTAGSVTALAGCLGATLAAVTANLATLLLSSVLLGSGTTTVMLGRYAAAELADDTRRAHAMASTLLATTIGAVAGPNLLAPAAAVADDLGAPDLAGPYLIATLGFVVAAVTLAAGLPAATDWPSSETGDDAPSGSLGRVGITGLAVLGIANLVMVAVMTMAPVHLHHHGVGLGAIGAIVSIHIAGMFAPSPLSGWLVGRIGPTRTAGTAAAVLVFACTLVAGGSGSTTVLTAALLLLGIGWNLALVAGSVLLTASVPVRARPRREGWGEVAMGGAAASGGATSGLVVASSGFPALAAGTAAVAAVMLLALRAHGE